MASPALDREAVEQAIVRGSDLLKQGMLDDAQKAFRAALQLDEGNARVLALLGLTYFRAGQFDKARPLYEDLVDRTPTDASHRLNLGLVYLKLGESDLAIKALEASRALDPSQGRAVSYLGLAYARAGRYAEAYRSFLLAGQSDLAKEIEINLTTAERDSIHGQFRRSGVDVKAEPAAPSRVITGELIVPPGVPPARDDDSELDFQSETTPRPAASQAAAPSHEITAPRMTESLQFVMPTRVVSPQWPTAEARDGHTMLSHALEHASPSSAAVAVTGAKIAAGSTPPIPLSQLATDELVRPDDGEEVFEITASGSLVIRISERLLTRLDGVHATGGDLTYEPALRRSRGHQIEDKFDYGGTQLYVVEGAGYLIAIPQERAFTAVVLDDDIFYLREDLVFAFEATLRWENGNVPGLRGRLPVVQFRGDGAVALRSTKPLVRVKLPAHGVVLVDAKHLAGWIGRVIPRAVVPQKGGPMGDMCVECTGEGIVLVDPVGDPGPLIAKLAAVTDATKSSPPPPPQPVESEAAKSAEWLVDDEDRAPVPPTADSNRDEI